MKTLVALMTVAFTASLVLAQERIADDVAKKFARLFVEQAGKEQNLQLKIDADPDQPYGFRHDEVGALVIPHKGLTEDALKKADKEPAPLGQLWVRKLTVVVKDQPTASDKLRIVTVGVDGQDHPLPLFLVGVRKKGDGMEVVLYGKDKEALVTAPLEKIDARQDLPIELEGKGEGERGTLTLNILGKYQAKLAMAKQD